jgi:3-oxoacyl-[acyl-carrier-protein] synthase III
MTAIEEISLYLPGSVTLEELPERPDDVGDRDLRFLRRICGLDRVHVDDSPTWTDQLLAAASGLAGLRGNGGDGAERVKYVIAARSVTPAVPRSMNPVHDVRDRLGLVNATAFTLTGHTCAATLPGVELAGRLLAADPDPDALALILAGERVLYPAMRFVRDRTVMSEGAAACLVSARGARDRVLSYGMREAARDDAAGPLAGGYPRLFADLLDEVVRKAGLSWDEIETVVSDNVSRFAWVQAAKLLGLPVERFHLAGVPAHAHCFTADPLINQVEARDAGRLAPGRPYVLAAASLTDSATAMVLVH